MITVYIVAGGVFFVICIITFVVLFNKYLEKREFIKAELKDIMEKCTDIEEKCKEGFAVFYPEDDEKYLYDMLVKKGKFIKNPMGKGYSFPSAEKELWSGVNMKEGFAKAHRYQDDDGVIQVFKDEDGNVIKTVTEEDLNKEKEDGDSRVTH